MRFVERSILIAAAVALPATGVCAAETIKGPIQGSVSRVIDGDTLEFVAHVWLGLNLTTHVRVRGIDCRDRHERGGEETFDIRHRIDQTNALLRAEWSRLDRPDRIQELAQRHLTLKPLETDESPFNTRLPTQDAKGVTFVRPELVGEVRYSERTSDGRLRQPSWRGLRPDKTPDEVRWEG